MAEIKAPVFPESVQDGTIVEWHVAEGEQVSRDQLLAEIETDKVVLEVVAPDDGVVTSILKGVDDTVLSAEVIAQFEAGATAEPKAGNAEELSKEEADKGTTIDPASVAAPVQPKGAEGDFKDQSPAVRKAAKETGVNPADVEGSGRGGRVTKSDMINPTLKTTSGSV
ncbi:biotin/lipoyl-containing protein, partial [Moraxella sp.]|uniref:biotin/lipoyl-containing protein n=1 Tax=Moraxella sp. TaxID=479 RepID=UPI00262A1703